jgi:hypothetical protein
MFLKEFRRIYRLFACQPPLHTIFLNGGVMPEEHLKKESHGKYSDSSDGSGDNRFPGHTARILQQCPQICHPQGGGLCITIRHNKRRARYSGLLHFNGSALPSLSASGICFLHLPPFSP